MTVSPTGMMEAGDLVKVQGWKEPKLLVKIDKKEKGKLAGWFADNEGKIAYYVIEDDDVVAIAGFKQDLKDKLKEMVEKWHKEWEKVEVMLKLKKGEVR